LKASSRKRVLEGKFSKASSQKRVLESEFLKASSQKRVLKSELSKASSQKQVLKGELLKVISRRRVLKSEFSKARVTVYPRIYILCFNTWDERDDNSSAITLVLDEAARRSAPASAVFRVAKVSLIDGRITDTPHGVVSSCNENGQQK
jgi:hypothetical protein